MSRAAWGLRALTACAVGMIVGFTLTPRHEEVVPEAPTAPPPVPVQSEPQRVSGYQFARPLIACAEDRPDTGPLGQLRAELHATMSPNAGHSAVRRAGAYVLDLASGAWTGVGEDQAFPVGRSTALYLAAALAREDAEPGFLDAVWGASSERMRAAITTAERDPVARGALAQLIGQPMLDRVAGELGLDGELITPRRAARVLQALYNGTYVAPSLSDLGLQVLSRGPVARDTVRHTTPEGVVAGTDCELVSTGRRAFVVCVAAEGHSDREVTLAIADILLKVRTGLARI